ncbi:Gfo/Idh/MocA family protein [Singulisphaera acidiphila]|uniref:Putative dehydrogenase n=1 Tax=Singulisphaera acidiphila (strain ATCC BAA-1392 / DSM 18658 / VKM B-2454 / MOB10) TaxID=886293 RepID=L0D8Y3_SINAD|nr:Gfo/Idh/MocA family oxidoreductase [Singulisphaera acidiphila]AGA25325.1 putative dehydrogenase [Singulisphaera acidiphila DSM 18658]
MSNRRTFLKQGGAGLVGAAAVEWAGAASAAGADETLKVGLIGCGGRGLGLLKDFAALKGVEIAYVCDPDRLRVGAASAGAKLMGQATPKVVDDFRRVLDDKAVDAVIVATPDHWHAPAAILACDAGKHVYVEKPCCHNFREGQLLVAAAKRSGRVVQHGTQSRSNGFVAHAIQLLHDGLIGKVVVAKAINVQRRADIGHGSPGTPPPHFDYDLWVGPAPFVPYQSNRHHYTWHWWYDFGTGDMGNDGVHELDIARWGLGVETHPSTVASVGGKYVFDDDQQFPDTQYVLFEYPGDGKPGHRQQLVFEMRIWSAYQPEGFENGNIFYGTDGWMVLSKSGTIKVFDRKGRPRPIEGTPAKLPDHSQDFVNAIREGRRPTAEIGVGFISTALCHLGNISTRVGRTLHIDPASEQIVGDDEAARLLQRSYRDGHWATPRGV